MRRQTIFIATTALLAMSAPAWAQDDERDQQQQERSMQTRKRDGGAKQIDCNSYTGIARGKCISDQKRAAQGGNSKDAALVNDTSAAARIKEDAGDFAGAIALYDAAIASAGKSAVVHHLYAGKAIAQRRQAVVAYNGAGQPQYPPAGASNDAIRAANAANAALQARKSAAAVPGVTAALATAAQAATLADASKDKTVDPVISVELREDAGLLYRLDRQGVLTKPRASAGLEAVWLQRWLASPTPIAESLVAKYGVPVAAALTAGDAGAGLALADTVKARTGNDVDGVIGYAEIVAAAKATAGDTRRAAALAGLTTVEPTLIEGTQRTHVTELKTALSTR